MEENKIDPFQIIGFVILMAGLFWWMNTLPELETTITENQKNKEIVIDQPNKSGSDINKDFSNSLNLIEEESDSFMETNYDIISGNDIIIENEDLILKFTSKGGLLVEAQLKNFKDYKGNPLYLVKDGNQNISLNFSTLNGKSVNTSNYNFKPVVNKGSDATTLTMVLSISENQYLNFEYIIPKKGFMMDFSINSTGFRNVIDDNKSISLNWDLKAFRQAKSVEYEDRYSQLYYQYDGENTDYLSSYSDSEEKEDAVSRNSIFFFLTITIRT